LPSTLVVGAVYFEVSTQRICVAKTTTTYDAFGVGLKSATLVDGILTITRHDNTNVTVDFNDIASATSVKNALDAINDKINTINGNDTTEGSIAYAVKAEKTRAEEQEGKIREEFAAADSLAAQAATEAYAAIRGEMAADKEELNGKINAKADAATTYSKTEVDNLLAPKANANDVYTKTEIDGKVETINNAISQEATDRGNAIDDLQGQIDDLSDSLAGVDVKHAEGDKYVEVAKDGSVYTVKSKGIDDAIAAAVGVEEARALGVEGNLQTAINTEKGRIDVLVGSTEGDDAKSVRDISAEEVAKIVAGADASYDTLKEIADWIAAHPDSVATLNAAIEANAKAISDEAAVRDAADKVHAQGIADLVAADEAQDELIGKKADQTSLDSTNNEVTALKDLVGTESVANQIDAKVAALKLDDTYVNESDYSDDQEAVAARIKGVEDRATDLEGRMTTAEADIDELQSDVANLQAATGVADEATAPDYSGSNYLSDAATMVAADKALDIKIKEVADSVTNKNVTAQGDQYVSATAADNKVTIATVVGTVESKSGLATNQGVYDALCWVEFE
jgi:hypothetical protein